MSKVLSLEAKCANCHQVFGYPSRGDFAYGEMVLCALDGKHHALATAFDGFAERVSGLLGPGNRHFWWVLASLADPVASQTLNPALHCPHCGSSDVEYRGGKERGTVNVPPVSFEPTSTLIQEGLAQRVAQLGYCAHEA